MVAVLQTDDLPQDVSGAEAVLLSHLEHKADIDAREASFTAFVKQGEALVGAGHYASKEVYTQLIQISPILTCVLSCMYVYIMFANSTRIVVYLYNYTEHSLESGMSRVQIPPKATSCFL